MQYASAQMSHLPADQLSRQQLCCQATKVVCSRSRNEKAMIHVLLGPRSILQAILLLGLCRIEECNQARLLKRLDTASRHREGSQVLQK